MVALGEHRADADDAMEERLQKQLARVLFGAGVFLADGGADGVVRNSRVEAKKPPGDRKIRDGLEIEHDVVGHSKLLQVSRAAASHTMLLLAVAMNRSAIRRFDSTPKQ